MTNEEAIATLRNTANRYYHAGHLSLSEDLNQIADVFQIALREQAERDKGCEYCNNSAFGYAEAYTFCPHCGRRLEAQHE